MRVLVINGSPKGESSNSMKLTRAFLEGAGWANADIVTVVKSNIKPCIGCFACWNKTPGKCVINDDMMGILERITAADIIIWCFPLYYFSVPGGLKNLIDRQLPLSLPFMTGQEGGGHPARCDHARQRHIVLSTCGFYTAEGNYAAVDAMFGRCYGEFERIYCGQGELFGITELKKRVEEYLETVRQAGAEYLRGGIPAATRAALNTTLYPKDVFERMADASWGIESPEPGAKTDETLAFTRQMAALYNKANYDKDRVFEIRYTDIGKAYQIALAKDGSSLRTDHFTAPGTVIETPYTLWAAIAAGEIEGSAALAEGKYRVTGDFTLMLKWDDLFGAGKAEAPAAPSSFAKRAKYIGGANIAAAAMGAAFLISGANHWFIAGLELMMALFWGVTVFLKVPLTCYFSAAGYGGEKMLKNPIFTRTNRILTACWAGEYLLMAIGLIACKSYAVPIWIVMIASNIPAPLLGIFTAWFQKWYPARMAKGGRK
ncbi:MAG: flavodoxin family protein [Christensenellaceae bacterium]|jgi:multimeric flavodoxin WrbA/putative sterol carrier protein|nr:flavodoxin family protein [Christensenellaceae bacterium]